MQRSDCHSCAQSARKSFPSSSQETKPDFSRIPLNDGISMSNIDKENYLRVNGATECFPQKEAFRKEKGKLPSLCQIAVAVRVRPRLNIESDESIIRCEKDGQTLSVQKGENTSSSVPLCTDTAYTGQTSLGQHGSATLQFDRVFQSSCSTDSVYRSVVQVRNSYSFGLLVRNIQVPQDAVQTTVDGYNASVFCYGQTGSGKTHTIFGDEACPGLLPLAVEEVQSGKRTFQVQVGQQFCSPCR